MSEVDARLKELLRETAEEMPVQTRMPERLRRRIRRRRAVTAAAAGLLAVALVAGGVLGADELLRETPATQRPGGEISPSVEPSPTPSPTPEPSGQTAVEAFVEDFMQRRLARSQAEELLSEDAARIYVEDHANGPYLYDAGEGDWPPEFYTGSRIHSVRSHKEWWNVTVLIEGYSFGEGDPVLFAETLRIGPGKNQFGESLDLVVLAASRQGGHERLPFSMSPTVGPRGTVITVSGADAFAVFDPTLLAEVIEIRGIPPGEAIGTIPVNPDGTWSGTVTVPADAELAMYGIDPIGLIDGQAVLAYQSQRFLVQE